MLIADGGGGSRPTVVNVSTVNTHPKPTTTNDTESDAAARARELQRQIEAMLERLREAQRRAEEARKRAIEAQRKAEQARQAADDARAQAEKTKAAKDEAAARKAEQESKLADALQKKESADASLKDKEAELLRAQVAQKKEEKKSADGKASPQADRKVDDAQAERDEARRTSDFSKLYADYQEKETEAQEAEAKVVKLTPAPGRPSYTISDEESDKLSTAQTKATDLRTEADEAKTRFTDTVGTDAGSAFFDSPAPQGSGGVPAKTTAALPDDPLHSPLQQLLQVSPQSTWHAPLLPDTTGATGWQSSLLAPTVAGTGTIGANTTGIGNNTTSLTTFNLLPPKQPVVTPEVTRTLDAIADGQSVYQIAEARGVGADKVMAEANAAGITLQSSTLSADAQQTTVKRGDATLTYTLDAHSGTVTVKGSFGGRNSVDASRDGHGRYSQTVQGEKAGETTTRAIDPQAGTRTETVVGADGKLTETTTDLTGATVRRPVEPGEGYLDVAEAAGLTPEQLLALNPDVDYGKPLEPGQELVVSGVRTTTKTWNADGTTLEKTVESDGMQHVVATTKDGRRVTLMGEPDKNDGPAEKIRKGLFEDGKSVADMARSLGTTEDQVLAALPLGTVDVASSGGVETRTLHDPETNRVVVETYDARHGKKSRQVIDEHAVFKVRQYDPETKKYVTAEVKGGVGYLQKQADDKLAYAGDLDKQISDLGVTIRLGQRTGEPVSELLDQRRQLVEQRDTAEGEADIAQAKATSALVKNQQVGLDKTAADAYQQQFVARPGSDEKKDATQALNKTLALVDKVDRLTQATDKDVQYLIADLERNQKHTAKVEADETLQTEFQKWKDEVWPWQSIPEARAKEMKAEGQKPAGPMYRSSEEENDAAWTAFVSRQEFLDEHGDETLTDAERPARDAWLQRNAASTAELESNDEYYETSIEKGAADANVIQGDIDRLQARKDAWVDAHPEDFSETFPGVKGEHGGQKELDLLNDQLTQVKVGGLIDGKDRKFNQYLMGQPVTDREDPEKLKELGQKYGEDNERDLDKVDQQIDDLMMGGLEHKAQVSEAYIEQWAKDNPELQAELDEPQTTGSVRAAETRRDELLSSHAGRQLKAALAMKGDVRTRLLPVADGDVELVQKDFDRVSKSVESQTWLRDVFSDTAEDSQADTKDQLDKAKALRDDLASGKITLTEYVHQRDELMGTYGAQSIDIAEKLRDSDETWAVVDDAVRMTVSAVAGIGTTILTGGNVAAGIAVGVGVNQLWDSGNDLYAAANGRDMYADGHSSLLTLRIRSMVDPGSITGEQVALTLKDDVVDVANAAVSATGVGAGMRSSAALAARIAARKGIGIGELSFGSRAVVNARSGLVMQGVDGTGRVGVETLHVGLDGKLGTEEGAQRIRAMAVSAAVGMLTAPLTGGVSGAIPMNKFAVGVGAQFLNDAAGSLGTGELIALANDGRHMNQAEFIAASLQTIPGTMTNIALHPSVGSGSKSAPLVGQGEPALAAHGLFRGNERGAGWRVTLGAEHPLVRSVNPTRSETNCVNSAITLDRMLGVPGVQVQAVPSGAKTLAQVFALYGDTPTAAFAHPEAALEHLAALPEGSRGFITMSGRGGAELHMVNFVRRNGDVEVIDAQAGRYVEDFDALGVHVIVTHEGGQPPVDRTVLSGPRLQQFLSTSPHDAPLQGPEGLAGGPLPFGKGRPESSNVAGTDTPSSVYLPQVGLPLAEGDSGGVLAMVKKFGSRDGLREFASAVTSTPRVKRHNTSSWITGRLDAGDYARLLVPIRSIRSQHSVDGAAIEKTAQRAARVESWLEQNPKAASLNMSTLDELAGSTGSIQVGWHSGDRFITLDGVGRVEAVRTALQAYEARHGTAHPLSTVETYATRLTDKEYTQLHKTSTYFRDAGGSQLARPQHDLVPFTAMPRFVVGTGMNLVKKLTTPLLYSLPIGPSAPDRRLPAELLRLSDDGGQTLAQGGAPRHNPSDWPRDHELGTHISMENLLERPLRPGSEGVILTDDDIRLGDLYKLSSATGVEYALAVERVEGREVFKLYSGTAWASGVPKTSTHIGHTHPNEVEGQQYPSRADVRSATEAVDRLRTYDGTVEPPEQFIIWGPGDNDYSVYYGGPHKTEG